MDIICCHSCGHHLLPAQPRRITISAHDIVCYGVHCALAEAELQCTIVIVIAQLPCALFAGAETAPKPPPPNLSSIDLKGSNATKLIEEVAGTTKNAAVKDLIALCVLANMFESPKPAEAAAAQQQEGE